MKIPNDPAQAFSLAVAGAWNPQIFRAQWVKEHLSDDQTRDVAVAFAIGAALPPRLTVDEINIYPSPQLLILDCVTYSEENISSAVRKLLKISELLLHTPVSAIGINFRFVGDFDESVRLTNLFSFSDTPNINSTNFALRSSLIKRTFNISQSEVLNFTLDTYNDPLKAEFNFHIEVLSVNEIREKLSEAVVLTHRASAIQFLHDVYEVSIDE